MNEDVHKSNFAAVQIDFLISVVAQIKTIVQQYDDKAS